LDLVGKLNGAVEQQSEKDLSQTVMTVNVHESKTALPVETMEFSDAAIARQPVQNRGRVGLGVAAQFDFGKEDVVEAEISWDAQRLAGKIEVRRGALARGEGRRNVEETRWVPLEAGGWTE
jgi:hypothetical protein